MYGKHFERMYEGSMRGAGADVFAVWGYAISHARPDSIVEMNSEVVAFLIGMPQDRVDKAMNFLESPDARSRNKEHEGRRMVKQGEFEYFLPSLAFYRGVRSMEDLREYNRIKQRESRERRNTFSIEGEKNAQDPEWDSVKKWWEDSKKNGSDYTEYETRGAFLALQANGWMWGRNPVTDWRSAIERQIQTDRERNKAKGFEKGTDSKPRKSIMLQDLERMKREDSRV